MSIARITKWLLYFCVVGLIVTGGLAVYLFLVQHALSVNAA